MFGKKKKENATRLRKKYSWEVCPLVTTLPDKKTILTETGEVSRLFKIEGKEYQGLEESVIDALKESRTQFFNLSEDSIVLSFQTHKYKKPNVNNSEPFSLPLAQRISDRYNEQFTYRFYTEHYLCVTISNLSVVNEISSLVDNRRQTPQYKIKLLDELETEILTSLKEYTPSIVKGDDIASYWAWQLNGDYLDMKTHNEHFIADLLSSSELHFPINERFMSYGGNCFTSFVFAKMPGNEVESNMLDDILKLPLELSVYQSIKPVAKTTSIRKIADKRETLEKWSPSHTIGFEELKEVEARIQADEIIQVQHRLVIEVKGNTSHEAVEGAQQVKSLIERYGYRSGSESVNTEASFWSRFPSLDGLNPRIREVTSANVADFITLANVSTGLEKCGWGDYPVSYFKNEYGSNYAFTYQEQPQKEALGHILAIGGSASGKTTLISFLISQSFKYPNFKAILFDRLKGMKVMTTLLGGDYNDFEREEDISFNPLQLEDSLENRAFLLDFIKQITRKDDEINERAIESAIKSVMALPSKDRTFKDIQLALGLAVEGSAAYSLERFLPGKTYGHYFNAKQDSLKFDAPLVGFDMTQVLDNPDILAPMTKYIFHQIFQSMKKEKGGFLVFVDEFPKYLKSEIFQNYVEVILQEIRKLDGVGIFAAQDAQTVFENPIAAKLKANIAGYLLYPDPKADRKYYVDIIGLTNEEYNWILKPHHRKVLFKRKGGDSAILDVDLSCLGDYLNVFNSSSDAVQDLEQAIEEKCDDIEKAIIG